MLFQRLRTVSWLLCCVLCLCGSAVSQEEMPQHRDEHAAEEFRHLDDDFPPEDPELAKRRQESFLMWMIRSVGMIGMLQLPVGLFCFVLTLLIVIRGNGPFAAAALTLIVPIPFLLGIFGMLHAMILSFQIIATSTVAPKPYQLADGVSTALFTPIVGLVLMTPSYLVAIGGSFVRSLVKPRAEIK